MQEGPKHLESNTLFWPGVIGLWSIRIDIYDNDEDGWADNSSCSKVGVISFLNVFDCKVNVQLYMSSYSKV